MSRKAILFTALVLFSVTSVLAGTPRQHSRPVSPTAVRALATATISADHTVQRYGEAIEITVTVAPSGVGQPTGIVWVIWEGGGSQCGDESREGICSAPGAPAGKGGSQGLLKGGKAIVTTSVSPVGMYSIHAEYLGDANFEPSVSNAIPLTVVKAATSVEAKIKGPYYIGGPSPLFVKATSEVNEYSLQGGNLILSEGGVSLIDRSPNPQNFFLDGLSGGEHTLVLSYSGSDSHEPSSTSLKVTILLPAFAVSGSQITEGHGGETSVLIPVTLSVPVNIPTRVSFATIAGSAAEGTDYQPVSGVLEFGPRDQVRFVEVKIIGDTLPENDESFSIVLSDPENGAIGTSSAIVVIGNDDDAPALSRRRSTRR